jgi:Cu-Zn family superoxide dismutase
MRKLVIGTIACVVALGAGALARKDDKGKKPAPAMTPPAPPGEMAMAELKDAKGAKVGEATLEQTPHGVLITVDLGGVAAGMHAFHVHEVGKCEPPFKTAGGHFNPMMKKHGIKNPEGDHAGDMPNIDVPENGRLKFQVLNDGITLKAGEKNSVLDADGSSIVIHAKADDLASDPAGNAGDRVACGVVTKK